jgi:hypothetical protein
MYIAILFIGCPSVKALTLPAPVLEFKVTNIPDPTQKTEVP